MKKCYKCKEEKEFRYFNKKSISKDGISDSCRSCEKVYKDANRESQKEYRNKNKNILNKKKNIYLKRKMTSDPLFKLSISIRNSINDGFRKNFGGLYKKNNKTYQILGCNFSEFKTHLESKFEPWMTWDNHGLYNGKLGFGWDIDHIIPISSAKNEKDLYKLNHFSNFQPLCSKVNRDIKRNKIT